MRLSPVLATVVAIAAPLSSSLSVNAQTSQKQKNPEVTIPVIEQPQESVGKLNIKSGTESGLKKTLQQIVVPTGTKADDLKAVVIVPTNWENKGKKVEQSSLLKPVIPISPSTATSKPGKSLLGKLGTVVTITAQNPTGSGQKKPPIKPTPSSSPVPLPEPVPEKTPTIQQQPTPSSSPVPLTEPVPEKTPTIQQQPNNPTGQPTQPNIDFGQPNQPNQPTPENNSAEPRVLVSEVVVKPQSGQLAPELEQEVYRVIRTQAGRTTTKSQLQEDIKSGCF